MKTCLICGGDVVIEKQNVKDSKHFIDGAWDLVRCKNCTVCFIENPPIPSIMGKYYPVQYYTHTFNDRLNPLVKSAFDFHYLGSRKIKDRLSYYIFSRYINMFPRLDGKTTMLDAGCGSGTLMARFEKYGFECWGYDVDKNAVAVGKERGLKIQLGDIDDVLFDTKFDVVIMNQVLEHLYDPVGKLKKIRGLLKDSGQLIISVPNSSSIDFKILKDSWTYFQAPTHLFHFNIRSLKAVCEQAGFSITRIRHALPLGSLKPSYIRGNFKNIGRIEDVGFVIILKRIAFIGSALFAICPFISLMKRNRITVYCARRIDQPIRRKI